MAKKLLRDSGRKLIPATGAVGFPNEKVKKGSKAENEEGDRGGVEDIAKCGYRKLDYYLDPHDRERNPRGGLREGTQEDKGEVDRDNDHDGD